MKLDFLICGTNTDEFLSQIAFFRLCLNALGGEYRAARLVATFGDHTEEIIPDRWLPYFENIDVIWSHEIGKENPDYLEQHYARYKNIREDSDLAIICDADTAILKPFPNLIETIKNSPAVCGVIANLPFPVPMLNEEGENLSPDLKWSELAKHVLGREIPLEYRYTLLPPSSLERSPFYLNYGFVAGPPEMMKRLGARERQILDKVGEKVGSYWSAQVSIPFSVELENLPVQELPFRYNFGNDSRADDIHQSELDEIIILHYYRKEYFDRHSIFSCEKSFYNFLGLDLQGSNKIFQEHVNKITAGTYPFPINFG